MTVHAVNFIFCIVIVLDIDSMVSISQVSYGNKLVFSVWVHDLSPEFCFVYLLHHQIKIVPFAVDIL